MHARRAGCLIPVLLSGLGLPATSCGQTSSCTDDASGCVDTGSTFGGRSTGQIERINWGCCTYRDDGCELDGGYWYDVVVRGRLRSASLEIIDTQSKTGTRWREEHELPIFDADPDDYWEDRYLELDIASTAGCETLDACEDVFITGQNTLFPCASNYTETRMTWVVRTYSTALDEPVECQTWGAEPISDDTCNAIVPNQY